MKYIMLLLIALFLISGCAKQDSYILSFTVKDTGTTYSEKIYTIFTEAGYDVCEVSARRLAQNESESFWVYDIRLKKEPDKESLGKVINVFDMENIVSIDMIQE